MSDIVRVSAVLEESKFKGINHVNVDKTVEAIKKQLESSKEVELISRQSEISRVGMIMKRVEEETKCRISSMKTQNVDEPVEGKDTLSVLLFKVIFTRL
jgi:hypothetical protein